MSFKKGQVVFFFFAVVAQLALGQTTSLREKYIRSPQDTLRLDTLSIYPSSLEVFCGGQKLSSVSYHLDHGTSRFYLIDRCSDSIKVKYLSLIHI
jgi:hypothetical protein